MSLINKPHKTYHNCDCGDYTEGCVGCRDEDFKEFVRKLKDRIVENDIFTADEIFRIINEEVRA